MPNSLDTARYRRKRASTPTNAELAFKRILDRFGIPFQFQPMIGNRIVDFVVLSRPVLLIEIDGGYHFTSAQVKKDRQRDREISQALGEVPALFLRFSDSQVFDDSAEATLKKLFPAHEKHRGKEVFCGYVSPAAIRSFYRFLSSGKSAPSVRSCEFLKRGRVMPEAPRPFRSALGAYMRGLKP
jgi:very-short-patch-repair endonuclease